MRHTLFSLAMGVLAAGCASYPLMTAPPVAPPASAVFIPGADGAQLYTMIEGDPEPRGVVWYVLGPEISSAPLYPAFTRALHQAGFATAVLHPRGTGYSSGVRGDIEDYALFLSDYQAFFARLRERFAGKPLFLMGHSAGAAFALHVAAGARGALAGVVLVNPAYKLVYSEGMGPSFCDYIVYAANYLCRPAELTVDMNSDPSAVKNDLDRAEALAMQGDPLVVRYFSMRYLFAQKEVMDRCAENIAATDAPVLIVQGAQDMLVDPKGNDELLAAASSSDKRRFIALNGGHGSSAVETMISPLVEWLSNRSNTR
jgi:alpha-beta hydrolase superfamily lysophospholipase